MYLRWIHIGRHCRHYALTSLHSLPRLHRCKRADEDEPAYNTFTHSARTFTVFFSKQKHMNNVKNRPAEHKRKFDHHTCKRHHRSQRWLLADPAAHLHTASLHYQQLQSHRIRINFKNGLLKLHSEIIFVTSEHISVTVMQTQTMISMLLVE